MTDAYSWSSRAWHAAASLALVPLVALSLLLVPASAPAQAQMLTFIRDTEIERLLSDYAQPIFRAAALGTGRVRIRIVKHEAFNAFVLDGRNVFVHTGMLTQSKTPNQVIGVIAHESGHIVGGHLAQLRDRIKRDQTKALLLKILGIGLMVAGGTSGSSGASGAGTGILLGGDELVMRSLLADRRAQEASADISGLRFLNATKQSGKGMLETFELFANQELISEAYKDPFVRSHPIAADRLANLRDLVAKSPYYGATDPPALQLRHDLMRAKIIGYLERAQVVANTYPLSDTSLAARYARAIAAFLNGGLASGMPQIEALIRERPENPYFWEVKGDFLTRSGKMREAIEPLRKALRLAGDAPLIRIRLAQALLALNEPASLPEVADLTRKSLIEDATPEAWRIMATVSYRQEKRPQADLATAEALFLEGDLKQAQIFAKRAKAGLRNGESDWLRANEIDTYKPMAGQ